LRRRIFFKLLLAFVVVIAVATVTLDFTIRAAWEKSLYDQIELSLTQKTQLLARLVQTDKQHSLQQLVSDESRAADARCTVIDKSGRVLADSGADAGTMENHAQRPEFLAALNGRIGTNSRSSHTLGVPFLYVAVPIPDGAVRMAYPLSAIQQAKRQIRRKLLEASALAFVIAIIIAGFSASSVSRRLRNIVSFTELVASGDLSARIAESSTDEIAQVAAALDKTARNLEQSFAAVETSRNQLETLLNSMQEAVIAVSADGRVLWANRRMNRIAPNGVRLNAPLIETSRNPDFLRVMSEALESGGVRTARVSSSTVGRTFDATVAPMVGGGAVAVLYDITKIERVEKTRRDFIANVSHELRTPLTSIQGYAETLLDTVPDGAQEREFIEIIRKNAARMSRLTEDLLTLARVESREQRFEFRPITPSALLQDAHESFREVARSAGIEIEVENNAMGNASADPDAIHQVFANLIDNAIKYAATGSRIVIGSRTVADADKIEFYVRDFGPGIASEHLPRLFERFYRVDKARSRESGGTGLGLAIVKHIVLAHHGTIRAESELNHGSTFFFTLPVVTADVHEITEAHVR
jgi:two-component system, OmpR family, phosphate regulon sensor histidine kinase PhoR